MTDLTAWETWALFSTNFVTGHGYQFLTPNHIKSQTHVICQIFYYGKCSHHLWKLNRVKQGHRRHRCHVWAALLTVSMLGQVALHTRLSACFVISLADVKSWGERYKQMAFCDFSVQNKPSLQSAGAVVSGSVLCKRRRGPDWHLELRLYKSVT